MPRLIIDDREIEVPVGTKVIDAAERLGIMIPRFCYHEALGSVGACRMCAVKFIQGPFKGVQMSCLIDAQDGMVVSTTDAEAVAFRRQVIEWLMMNHPHDCPVCDEGGQCLLQDETVSGGHGLRRYLGKKRTYRDQYLGVFIQHEMNRCIHCYRCSRFYQEFAGYRDLGPLQIGNRLYFGRFSDGQLESPFSGNLVDLCPTGVYTDKPARYKVRNWDLQRTPSLCIHCSLGCNTVASTHYRAVMRIEGRFNEAVNGYFLCDAGRFGFGYANGGTDFTRRCREARVDGNLAQPGEAVTAAAGRIAAIAAQSGPRAVALLGSARNSLETECMMKHLSRAADFRAPDFFLDPAVLRKTKDAAGRLDSRTAVSMGEIHGADFVLVAGADPLNEGPMAVLAIRQAFRNGAPVGAIDPRPLSMPLEFTHIPAPPDAIEPILGAIVRASIREEDLKTLDGAARRFYEALPAVPADPAIREKVEGLAGVLAKSRRPVVVCGTGVVRESAPAFAADCGLLLAQVKEHAGLFYLLPGAGAFGAAVLSGEESAFQSTLEAIERGEVRALVAVESDPFRYYPDRKRLEEALAQLDLLVSLDYLPCETAQRAHVFIPASAVFETGASYVNQEGRVQFAVKAHCGGVPVWGSRPHPSRTFRADVPGGAHKPAWEILADLGRAVLPGSKWDAGGNPALWIFEADPLLAVFGREGYPLDGVRIVPERSRVPDFENGGARSEKSHAPGEIEILPVDWIFGTEELSAYADAVSGVVPAPVAHLHAADAHEAGLAAGDTVRIELARGAIEVKLAVSEKMARGVLVLPRNWALEWQKMAGFSESLPLDRIKRVPL